MSLFYGYTDEENKDHDKKYLSIEGGKMNGNIDMRFQRIIKLGAPLNTTDGISKIYLSYYINTILIETLIREYYQKAAVTYRFLRGDSSEINIINARTRNIDKKYDQSLYGDDASTQDNRLQPIL